MGETIGPRLKGPGNLGNTEGTFLPWTKFNNVLSISIGVLSIIAAIWFLFILITGAISYMQAGGDKGKVEEARKKITTGFIGILIVISAIFIANFVGYILGFDILNPGEFLEGLDPDP